jgi:tetraacyldisaccharide 4'-kinase
MYTVPRALAPVVYIPGLVFEALIRMRGGLYAASMLPQRRLPAPVISVGNITMGGAGKTPLVIYLAQTLSKLGLNPAVLSRGYGRRNPHESRILPPGATVPAPALALGDEPALLRRHLPLVWLGIAKNRLAAGRSIASRQKRTVFILDDGFQHRRLYRDLDIVIIDRSQPLGANLIFPRGSLREPLSELRRCHMVVLNGMPAADVLDPVESEIRSLHPKAALYYCRQTIRCLIPFPSWKEGCEPHPPAPWPQSVYLATAVGNPERFRRDVGQLGIEVRGTRFFADHYWLTNKDWLACAEDARTKGADAILTTEKDAVKISQPPNFPLLVSVQSTEISDARAFELALNGFVEERP